MAQERSKTRFGRFELLHKLGGGGIADVYKAIDTESNRTVMLRILSQSCSQNPRIRQVYEDYQDPEYVRFDDPNVLRVVDCGLCRGRYFFAFEYLDGQTLEERMKEGRISSEEALAILRQVAEALRGAHQRKITHGDIKPASIYVGRDRRNQLMVKLSMVDLALAGAEAMVSIYGEMVGTPKYMSPEQIEGRHVGPRSDLFSLGVVAYEMFGGREPFQVQTPVGYLRANVEREATPLAALDTSIPIEISKVVQRMMAREPVRRYRSCQSLLDDLDRLESRMAGDVSEVAPAGTDSAFAAEHPMLAAPRSSGVHLLTFGALTAALVLFVTTLALLWILLRDPASPPVVREPAAASSVPEPATPAGRVTPTRASRPVGRAPLPAAKTNLADVFDTARARAVADIQDRRHDEAVDRYERLLLRHRDAAFAKKVRQEIANVLYQKGQGQAADKGDASGAAETFARLVKEYGDTRYAALARRRLARLLSQSVTRLADAGRLEEARETVTRLRAVDPDAAAEYARKFPKWLLTASERALGVSQPEKAIAFLNDLGKRFPGTPSAEEGRRLLPRAYEVLGQKRLAGKDYAGAWEALSLTRSAQGQLLQAQALLEWIRTLWRAGDQARALEKFALLQQRFPNSGELGLARKELPALVKLYEEVKKAGGGVTAARIEWIAAEKLRNAADRGPYDRALARLRQEHPLSREAALAAPILAKEQRSQAELLLGQGDPEKVLEGRRLIEAMAKEFPETPSGRWAREQVVLFEQVPPGMVFIPAGSFSMGLSVPRANELAREIKMPRSVADLYFLPLTPQRTLRPQEGFAMGRTEVTNAQYEKFIRSLKGARAPAPQPPVNAQWDGDHVRPGYENYPVTSVSLADASTYAKWAGKRLPTEEEWERAARGPRGRLYPWGDKWDARAANVAGSGRAKGPLPVGSCPRDKSEAGLMDMAGNIREWTSSRYAPYPGGTAPSQLFQAGARVVRGGAFKMTANGPNWVPVDSAAVMRTSLDAQTPPDKLDDVGFRCAKTVDSAKIKRKLEEITP